MYTPVQWPEIQYYMDKPGFEDHAFLINDDKGIETFGSSAYFIEDEWLNKMYDKIFN